MSETTAAAFDGIRVLDASRTLVGAMAAMYLADQGADVVRVLDPGRDPVAEDPGYLCWDRNKTTCVLDRESGDGLVALRRLIRGADVVILDDPPGVNEVHRLDAVALVGDDPALIHLWLPMFAPSGRWSRMPSDPLLADAVNGTSAEHMSYDGGPIALVTPLVSYAQAMLGATSVAAALYERNRSGLGQGLVVSGQHAMVAMHSAVLTDAPGVARIRSRAEGAVASYRLYRCGDGGWLYLGALTEPMFIAALEATGLVDVLVMPGVEGRMLNLMKPEVGGPVAARMEQRFAEKPRAEWERILTAAGVPNAPAQSRDDWWESDIVASSGLRDRRRHPQLGTVELPGDPVALSRTPGVFRHLPGEVGIADAAELWTTPRRPIATVAPPAGGQGALAGLRVLDLGAFVAGPFAASLFTDYGADVVKVETPGRDPYRLFSVSFAAYHQAQRDIVLDLKSADGRAALYALVRDADVLLDNVRPGVRERLGIDYATLAEINPRLVRGTVTAWGVGNALSATPAFDPLIQSRSGLIAAQGGDGPPTASAMLVHDIGTGSLAAFGLLAALYARDRDGLGQEVTTSMVAASTMLQSGEFVRYAGRPPAAVGARDFVGPTPLRRLFACRDGWIAIAATTDEHCEALCRAFGIEPGHETGVAEQLEATLQVSTTQHALDLCERAHVPAVPVLPSGAELNDPWMTGQRLFHTIADPDVGNCTVVRTYGEWSRTPTELGAPSPRAGEHTRELLAAAGYDDAAVTALLTSGAAVALDA